MSAGLPPIHSNPYAHNPNMSGQGSTLSYGAVGGGPRLRMASYGQRFAGALVDSVVALPFMIPGFFIVMIATAMEGPIEQNAEPEPSALAIVGMILMFLGMLACAAFQIYLLATRSQSIGKYVAKTQIVEFSTLRPATFVSCFLVRGLVNGLIAGIPCIGAIYALVDILFIFRDDRRCVHDLLANTNVVDIT